MTSQGTTRKGATPAQKAALAKAREARTMKSGSGSGGGMTGGGGNLGQSLGQLNRQFENIQQLEKLTQQFWKDAKPYIGSFQTTGSSGGQTKTRGGTSAQHAKAGQKGGQAKAQSQQANTA